MGECHMSGVIIRININIHESCHIRVKKGYDTSLSSLCVKFKRPNLYIHICIYNRVTRGY